MGVAVQAVNASRTTDNFSSGESSGFIAGQCTSRPGTLPVMQTSAAWINDYLHEPVDAATQAELLTHAGFPLESSEEVEGDVRQDYEMTSNRGDCMCHVGLAREIAAVRGGQLRLPTTEPVAEGAEIDAHITITNHETSHCPLYTGRVITDVTVGPSEAKILQRLTARGDIPRSNIVDATNFVLFELGQPTHVFDLDTIAGGAVHIRMARAGERFLPIGEDAQEIELKGTELVIADAEKPIALAGVKGGALTAVTDQTKNILIEAASFDPVIVRHASRLHGITSDSSARFERGVSPGQVDAAADRLARLILDAAGGALVTGVARSGGALPTRSTVTMRPQRCRDLLGLDIGDETQVEMLGRLEFEPVLSDDGISATVPWHRGDITREVDLIEEVMRMHGFADVPVQQRLNITPAQASQEHRRTEALSACLVGAGFVETVTHSLISEAHATPFLPSGGGLMQVDASKGLGEPVLRPSIIPSLLRVRRHNADRGVDALQLFEMGSTFVHLDGRDQEHLELGLLMDLQDVDQGVRPMRGVIDRIAEVLAGPDACVDVTAESSASWLSDAGTITINGAHLGDMGVVAPATAKACGLDEGRWLAAALRPTPWIVAEITERQAHRLPDLPAMERDLSAIVTEDVSWRTMSMIVHSLHLQWLEAVDYVTVWRGKGVPTGHKSVTMRLRFRDAQRTLTREDVEPLMQQTIKALQSEVQAEIRS